jgi:hypothetical protein
VRRQAYIAIVEPDHMQAMSGQVGAEVVRPAMHLPADAHRQEHGRRSAVPKALEGHVDARGADVHDFLLAHVSIRSSML